MRADGKPEVFVVRSKNTVLRRNVLSASLGVQRPVQHGMADVPVVPARRRHRWRGESPDSPVHGPEAQSPRPVDDVTANWKECGPEAVRDFSAVAYHFGRALNRTRNVPVGLIHTSWGGSPAEVWMSKTALTLDPEYRRDIWDKFPAAEQQYQATLAQWEKDKAAAEASGQKLERGRPWEPWRPAELYNGMIAPLIPYAISGAIWYQGESNADRAWQYRRLFPTSS
jgi:sialate O-acetylesterase